MAELAGEKIDVIPWSDDAGVFVANALSPAQVLSVDIDEEHRIASVTVPERMLSLAIGREGQNARLAARLTGWRIDIRSDVSVAEARAADDAATEADAGRWRAGRRDAGRRCRRGKRRDRRPTRRRRPHRPSRSGSPRRPLLKPPPPRLAAEPPATEDATEAAPAKPKRVTKKAAAEAAAPAANGTGGAATAEAAPVKPKRTTKKAAAEAASTEPAAEEVAS